MAVDFGSVDLIVIEDKETIFFFNHSSEIALVVERQVDVFNATFSQKI